jgi:hypothetical protein
MEKFMLTVKYFFQRYEEDFAFAVFWLAIFIIGRIIFWIFIPEQPVVGNIFVSLLFGTILFVCFFILYKLVLEIFKFLERVYDNWEQARYLAERYLNSKDVKNETNNLKERETK